MLEALREKQRNLKKNWMFAAGLAAVLFMALPYVLLGADSVVTCHDQLDGELIAYILQARHLFGGSMLPEFLGGASKTALTMPAPACLLLFLTGQPFAAYVIMQAVGSVTGYVGMYLLAGKAAEQKWIAVTAGVLFAYLPFLPVYGLSQYGVPLLFWCFWEMLEGRHQKVGFWYSVFFAASSSLVLSGFGLLGLLGAAILWQWLRGRRQAEVPVGPAVCCWLAMAAVYVLENLRLFSQLLGIGGDGVSHKAEYVLDASPFWPGLATAFLKGGQHSEDYHQYILAAALAVLAAGCALWLLRKTRGFNPGQEREYQSQVRIFRLILGLLACNLFLALLAALWNGGAGVWLRSQLSALGAFQLDRVLWMAPALWYLILACVLGSAAEFWKAAFGRSGRTEERFGMLAAKADVSGSLSADMERSDELSGKAKRSDELSGKAKRSDELSGEAKRPGRPSVKIWKYGFAILCVGIAGLCAVTGMKVLLESNLKPNLQKCLNPDYNAISYGDYYALGVMEQVEAYIRENAGLVQNEYRVASLGIDPAAALYAGFYTLDGYSNNYALSYKHSFRRIIAPELEKSGYLRDYYDGWGNRCYLLSAECPAYYTVEKGGFFFQDLKLDANVMRDMGCRYVLSAAYIANAGETGLALVREEPFQTEDSYYNIYLYEVVGGPVE